MSYVALYRKWRPKVFEDVIGQEHIIRTIKNQIISGRIPHAYLFCGSHGTGKTSTAKILARAVNCLNPKDGDPCNECEVCREINAGSMLDVIEIDAASNRKVENARDLIETVKYPPNKARYKVYIIDEVHMLTTEAFNTLLKTLEEPPSYVIFILATTDPEKVLPTILSRCQRFDFKRIKADDMVKSMRSIADENSIEVEDKTLKAIAGVSDGAMRDALSILDQAIAMSEGKIEYNDVMDMLGIVSNEYVLKLCDAMADRNVEGSIRAIDDVIMNGKDVLQFIKDVVQHFRNMLMIKISKKPEEIINVSEETLGIIKKQAKKYRSEDIMRAINIMVEAETNAKGTLQPRIFLEMAAVKYCKIEYDTSPEVILSRLNLLEEKIKTGTIKVSAAPNDSEKTAIKKEEPANKTEPVIAAEPEKKKEETIDVNSADAATIDEAKSAWADVLNLLKTNKKMVIYAYLEPGDITDVRGNNIIIGFSEQYAFSKKNLDNPENKKTVEECFSKVLNKNIKVEFKVIEKENSTDKSIEMAKAIIGEDNVEIIE